MIDMIGHILREHPEDVVDIPECYRKQLKQAVIEMQSKVKRGKEVGDESEDSTEEEDKIGVGVENIFSKILKKRQKTTSS